MCDFASSKCNAENVWLIHSLNANEDFRNPHSTIEISACGRHLNVCLKQCVKEDKSITHFEIVPTFSDVIDIQQFDE